jgi:hypothetical protein
MTFFAKQWEFRTGDYEEVMNKVSCLSLLSNAALVSNSVQMSEIVPRMRAGRLGQCWTRTTLGFPRWPMPT